MTQDIPDLQVTHRAKNVQEINILPLAASRANNVQLGLLLCPVHQSAKTFEEILDVPQANIQKRLANQQYRFIVQVVLRGDFLTIKVQKCILVTINVQVEDIQRK